jgi:hypothetical protein
MVDPRLEQSQAEGAPMQRVLDQRNPDWIDDAVYRQ